MGIKLSYQPAVAIDSGFTRGAHHVNYPDGQYNDALITWLRSVGALTGRTTEYGLQNSYALTQEEAFRLKVVSIDNSDPYYLQLARSAVQEAYYEGKTVIFVFHKIEAIIDSETTYPGISMLTEDFANLVQYIKEYTDRGDLTVQTISQWYNILSPS